MKIQNYVKNVARNLWKQMSVKNLKNKKNHHKKKKIVDVKMAVWLDLQ